MGYLFLPKSVVNHPLRIAPTTWGCSGCRDKRANLSRSGKSGGSFWMVGKISPYLSQSFGG